MVKKIKSSIYYVPLILLTAASLSLRFINLGYSDYQGDEIKALFVTDQTNIFRFLLEQRKGPGQFIVTYLIRFINPDYSNEFITRAPFALAGVLTVIFFYKLTERHFGKKVAFYASALVATNGFFIAFSRIVQYQSFVILFTVLALYFFSLKKIYAGFLLWSLAILFHYDGIFIAPFVFYLTHDWYKSKKNNKAIIAALAIFLLPILVFYIPFAFSLSQRTLDYWSGRISGNVSSKLSSSMYLFSVYQPIYVVHFYSALFIFGILAVLASPVQKLFSKSKILNSLPNIIQNKIAFRYLFLWFLLPFLFLELVVYIPGTHIFTYILPLTVILAYGIVFIEETLQLFKKYFFPGVLSAVGLTVFFSFLYMQSYAIFVDNRKEYPFEGERFLLWEFPQPNPIYHLSIFGFPYYRNWEGIRSAISSSQNNGFYSTNERESISRYYVPLSKSTDKAGHYIYIINPQSFTGHIYQDKADYWAQKYQPVFTFSRGGQDLVRVYYMEPGTLDEILVKGF